MASFPAANTFNDAALTWPNFDIAIEAWLAANKQLPGAAAVSELTLASGVIVPTSGAHTVDTEGNAASDDLTNIQYDNLPDGSIIILWPESASRVVTLKHMAGSIGQISLVDAADFVLDAAGKSITLQRRVSVWYEVARSSEASALTHQVTTMNWFIARLCGIWTGMGGNGSAVYAFGASAGNGLRCQATSPASMAVTVLDGAGFVAYAPFIKWASETSAAMTAPSSHPRIDTVAIVGASGRISIHTGLEAASPAAPAIAAGEIKVAEIYHRVGETNIKDADDSTNGYITLKREFCNSDNDPAA